MIDVEIKAPLKEPWAVIRHTTSTIRFAKIFFRSPSPPPSSSFDVATTKQRRICRIIEFADKAEKGIDILAQGRVAREKERR